MTARERRSTRVGRRAPTTLTRCGSIAGDGVELAVLDEGEGHPVLLLHGFPDSSRVWRHQVAALSAAGMRAIVPDLRGFGESDKPAAVEGYAIARSVADMVAILDTLAIDRAHVVGHDSGAVVAWLLAALLPDRVDHLVAMSVGHPAAARLRTMEDRERPGTSCCFSSPTSRRRCCSATSGSTFANGSKKTATSSSTSTSSHVQVR
jgi:pimeloyl-ACP methyl ester carboxylesterase